MAQNLFVNSAPHVQEQANKDLLESQKVGYIVGNPAPSAQEQAANKAKAQSTAAPTSTTTTTSSSTGGTDAVSQARAVTQGLIDNPTLPANGVYNPAIVQDSQGMYQNYQQLDPSQGQVAPVQTGDLTTANAPGRTAANTYDASQVGPNTPQAQAAQGTVDPGSIVTAAQAEVDPRSTVRGQLAELYNDEDQTWAAGAKRSANEAMAARGLGNSSIAGQAITQSVMEAALPIASADANIFAQFQLQNLNNRQQAALANAEKYQAVNLQNLSNEQQTVVVNQQARLQALLSDQAAENASKQFNAASQNQTDQFFAGMEAQIEQYNAGQANAMSQFNAGQENAYAQFIANMANQRDQFNTTQRAVVDQSNLAWRRSINTANTATINDANKTNAQNALNLSNWALNSVWQQFRDEADFAFTAGENDKNRAASLAIAQLQAGTSRDLAKGAQSAQMASAIGGLASNVVGAAVKYYLPAGGGSSSSGGSTGSYGGSMSGDTGGGYSYSNPSTSPIY